jgi:K+-sensing histidine kinase KdpD
MAPSAVAWPSIVWVLRAFTDQLAVALESRRLTRAAAEAALLAEANQLRTALLAAVSHDLRTPLASIKTAVTGLLQDDVTLPPEATPSCWPPSTSRPTGWIGWSATCST